MKNSISNDLKVGDLVVRRGKNSADVRFVEGIYNKDNPEKFHVLLVNGIKDLSYEGKEGMVMFNNDWRLLAKEESLEKEAEVETCDIFGETIFGYPEDNSLFTIYKKKVVDNLYRYEVSIESAIIYDSFEEALNHYKNILKKFEHELKGDIGIAYEGNPIYKSYGVTIYEDKVYHSKDSEVECEYMVLVGEPLFYDLGELYLWLKGVVKEIESVIEKINEKVVEEKKEEKKIVGRDPNRIRPLLSDFEALWNKHPYIRFGQLVSVLALSEGDKNIFYIEDDKWKEYIEKGFNS